MFVVAQPIPLDLKGLGGSLKKLLSYRILLFIVRRQNLKKAKNQVTTYVSVITHLLSLLSLYVLLK
jgi:hypothetical protein